MEKTSKKELLRQVLAGEIKAEDLLPDTIVILTDYEGNKINPATGKQYSTASLKSAKNIIYLPINGRENYNNSHAWNQNKEC